MTDPIANTIAGAAFLVACGALAWSVRTEKRMPELVNRQIAELSRGDRERRSARVLARWIGDHVTLTNEGHAPAEGVNVRFAGSSPLQVDDARDLLPIPSLQPGTSARLLAPRSSSNHPPAHAFIEWRDANGSHTVEQTLT